jgi:hypothetical protein
LNKFIEVGHACAVTQAGEGWQVGAVVAICAQ